MSSPASEKEKIKEDTVVNIPGKNEHLDIKIYSYRPYSNNRRWRHFLRVEIEGEAGR